MRMFEETLLNFSLEGIQLEGIVQWFNKRAGFPWGFEGSNFWQQWPYLIILVWLGSYYFKSAFGFYC